MLYHIAILLLQCKVKCNQNLLWLNIAREEDSALAEVYNAYSYVKVGKCICKLNKKELTQTFAQYCGRIWSAKWLGRRKPSWRNETIR